MEFGLAIKAALIVMCIVAVAAGAAIVGAIWLGVAFL